MATCAECGDGIEAMYDCHDCGDVFCVDCRLPDDHECVPATEPDTASDGGATTVDSPSVSLPSFPRITVFLPVWRAIPWQIHALLAILLVPVSPLVLAQHVYHERVADAIDAKESAEDEAGDDVDTWAPGMIYYFPVLMFVAAAILGRGDLWVLIVLGGIPGLITTLVYVVQKWRHE